LALTGTRELVNVSVVQRSVPPEGGTPAFWSDDFKKGITIWENTYDHPAGRGPMEEPG
jgi:hypothetical protein